MSISIINKLDKKWIANESQLWRGQKFQSVDELLIYQNTNST